MTLKDLLSKIAAAEGWKLEAAREGWNLVVPTVKDRTQIVAAVDFKDGKSDMVRYTSVVGDRKALDGPRLTAALELNARLPHGCLALDGKNLVITATRPLATTTAETSAAVVRYVAAQSDKYERLIYGADRH